LEISRPKKRIPSTNEWAPLLVHWPIPPIMIFQKFALLMALLGMFALSKALLVAQPVYASTPTTLVCIEELDDCPGEQATIRILQIGEVTIISFELCGEVYSTEVPADSSDPICGTMTCCSTGQNVSLCGELTGDDTTWGDVTDCDDYIII
jgi:hypothetical protein